MFIETQDGRLFNIEKFRSIERLSNEIYGILDNASGSTVLIYSGKSDDDAMDEMYRIERYMRYCCVLIAQGDDGNDFDTSDQDC